MLLYFCLHVTLGLLSDCRYIFNTSDLGPGLHMGNSCCFALLIARRKLNHLPKTLSAGIKLKIHEVLFCFIFLWKTLLLIASSFWVLLHISLWVYHKSSSIKQGKKKSLLCKSEVGNQILFCRFKIFQTSCGNKNSANIYLFTKNT